MSNLFLPIILTLLVFIGCTKQNQEPATLTDKVQQLNMDDQYEQALEILHEEDQDENTVHQLLIATHLNYALYLTHESDMAMTERMPSALRHFRRVLELDPNNARARAEAAQIESIYRSLGRDIPEGVAS
ncbi:MAG: hypothetical protein WD267_00640 [Balneolales bacterium]